MNLHFRQSAFIWLMLMYWCLSFVNGYVLSAHPLSSEGWQWIRIQVLLVLASAGVTLLSGCISRKKNLTGDTRILIETAVWLHGPALLFSAGSLFYQWRWDGLFVLQCQGYAFALALFILPVATFLHSKYD